MQIIFDKATAEQLRQQHTVLELETITKDGVTIDAFCLIPAEKIALTEMPNLQHNIKLHNEFINAYKAGNYQLCRDLYKHVIGKFAGEVDSFYEEIISRIK